MIEWNDLIVGNLYYYKDFTRIWFYGSENEILLSNKELGLLLAKEPFVMLAVLRETYSSNSFFRCKILSPKGIIGYIDINSYYIVKYNGENND